jgi:dTDP-4-dehydrorhamnose reductase
MERVALTGATGRVGSALLRAFATAGSEVVSWKRPDYDLDDLESAARVVERDRPDIVFHTAAWTDVEGCALNPVLATRWNGLATAELAIACARVGASLVYLSTNEVFSGDRTDNRGYTESDATDPQNAYGRSKLAGEDAIHAAYMGHPGSAWIVRTSWVFGPPGNDFPTRIVAAADRQADQPLGVVTDEHGRPTYAADYAAALIRLVGSAPPGTYHLAGEGAASRFEWAEAILGYCRPATQLVRIHMADYRRASTPPRWGVLDTSRAASLGVTLRSWREPLAGYLGDICRKR